MIVLSGFLISWEAALTNSNNLASGESFFKDLICWPCEDE